MFVLLHVLIVQIPFFFFLLPFSFFTFFVLKVNSEEINPIYEDLRSKEENFNITISGLKAKKTSLENLATTAQEKIHQLDEAINSKQLELNDLNRKVDMAQTYYSTMSSNYLQSSFMPLSPVTISEEPVLPERPVKPNKKLNVAIAGVASLFFSILLAFFLEYWYQTKSESK